MLKRKRLMRMFMNKFVQLVKDIKKGKELINYLYDFKKVMLIDYEKLKDLSGKFLIELKDSEQELDNFESIVKEGSDLEINDEFNEKIDEFIHGASDKDSTEFRMQLIVQSGIGILSVEDIRILIEIISDKFGKEISEQLGYKISRFINCLAISYPIHFHTPIIKELITDLQNKHPVFK